MSRRDERRGPLDGRVLGLAPGLRAHLGRSVGLASLVAVAVLVQAEALGRLLPRLVDGDGAAVRPLVVWLVFAAGVRAAAASGFEVSAARAMASVRRTVRTEILDRVAMLRADRPSALGPAEIEGLVGAGVDAVEPWARAYLPALVVAAVVPAVAGVRIAGADVASAVVLAVVVPLVPVFMVLVGWATEGRAASQWEALQRLSARFLDTLTGMPTLRLFGRAASQADRVREVTDRYRRATMRTLRVAFLSALVLELLATLSVAIVAVGLGVRLTSGGIGLTDALVVLLLAPEVLLPLRRVGAAFHAATAGVDAAADVERVRSLPERPHGDEDLPATGDLVLEDVDLVDPVRGVRLPPTSLRVRAGEVVAVVGPSGAGKSSLLDVARGALAPTHGAVHLGPIDVGRLRPVERARVLRWVPQRPRPLGSTVAGSAALGLPSDPATESAVRRALVCTDLVAAADRRPDTLSGGELRRLAVARALAAAHRGRARFLLLDEPTAQLDPVLAAGVRTAIAEVASAGVGVVMATHDPALVAAADRVVAVVAPAGIAPPPPSPSPRRPVARPATSPTEDGPDDLGADAGAGDTGWVRWVLGRTRLRRWDLVRAVALGVLADAAAVALAGTAAWLVVRAAERPSFADLAVAAVAVRACGLGKGVFRYGERLASHDATLRLLADLRADVVARLARVAPAGLPDGGRGEALTRVVADVDRIQDLFLRAIGPGVSALVVATGATIVAGVLAPAAGAAMAVALAVVGVVSPVVAARAARRSEERTAAARGALAASVVGYADDVEELVACGADGAARREIEGRAARLEARRRVRSFVDAATAGLAAAGPAFAAAAVVAVAGPARAGLSGPALGVAVLLPLAVLELVAPLVSVGPVVAAGRASALRVRALLAVPNPVVEPTTSAAVPATAEVVVTGADLAWPGADVAVRGVDLAVPEGARVVVAGPSGSGKSTLAATLVRFLEVGAGAMEVGGVGVGRLGGDAVRRVVTWCPQDPWFSDTSLADGLRIARPDATDAELWAALRTVHLDEWVAALPHGLDTRLDRDAEMASGGQRQRLALARALLGDRRVLVLDEPTSHLDPATAAAVLDDLLAAAGDRSVVLLAHEDRSIGGGTVHHRIVPHGEQAGSRWTTPTPELADAS